MDFDNFENEVFNELPELIVGSNFMNCIFNVGARFERCNIEESTVNEACYFDRSNIIMCTGDGLDESTYDRSNREDEAEDEFDVFDKI